MSNSTGDLRDRFEKKHEHNSKRSQQNTIETTYLDPPHIEYVDQPSSTHMQQSNWRDDTGNLLLLTYLYVLQGVPMGLAASIPMLLQSRRISYKEQAMYSFVFWPFSMKLLWAPIVDSMYLTSIGRRKSWMVPSQYLIGLFMIILSFYVKEILGDEGSTPNVFFLTCIFFMLNLLSATQDIAVDGWALTMLSKHNVGWASTCNTVGQNIGFLLGNVLFITLESADFCNKYLRSLPHPEGVVTLDSFLFFWGIVFFVTTTLVFFLKPEKSEKDDPGLGIIDTYKLLIRVIKLPTVVSLAVISLTARIGFAACDSLTGLKLIEAGVRRERLAMFAIPMIPIQIILPLLISKYTSGPKPMDVFMKALPPRLLLAIPYAGIVYMASRVAVVPGVYPLYFNALALSVYALHQVACSCMFVAGIAFISKVSDPAIGGSYMSLLNTLYNLGGKWPATLSLWLVDNLTFKGCSTISEGSCNNSDGVEMCTKSGGSCLTIIDGYYVEIVFCILIGFLWYYWKKGEVQRLQNAKPEAWKVPQY